MEADNFMKRIFLIISYFISFFTLYSADKVLKSEQNNFYIAFSRLNNNDFGWELKLYDLNIHVPIGRVYFYIESRNLFQGEIRELTVIKKYRKQNYGAALFVMAKEMLRSLGVKRINITLSPEDGYEEKLENFYQSLGCKKDSKFSMHLDLKKSENYPENYPYLSDIKMLLFKVQTSEVIKKIDKKFYENNLLFKWENNKNRSISTSLRSDYQMRDLNELTLKDFVQYYINCRSKLKIDYKPIKTNSISFKKPIFCIFTLFVIIVVYKFRSQINPVSLF